MNNWERLYESTERMKRADSGHDMFSKGDNIDLQNLIKVIMHEFLSKDDLHIGIKVYVDRKLTHDYMDKMCVTNPLAFDTLEQWCAKVFGDKRFGMVVNSLEAYSNEIGEKMITIIHPLLKKAGLPLGGLSFLFFMGNYGFTPFGIHKEAQGEEGFLFHLGPAEKKFYTWDIESLNKIEHNTQVFHNVDEMLPSAKCYNLSTRSVMFIPHHLYHIGNSEEFSLSVVMDYINPSMDALEQMMAKEIFHNGDLLPQSTEYLSPVDMESSKSNKNSLTVQDSWKKKFELTLRRRIQRLKSNGGIGMPSIMTQKHLPSNNSYTIRGKKVFPIGLLDEGVKHPIIMARGHEIIVRPNKYLLQFVHEINTGKTLSVHQLKELFEPEWDIIDVYGLINELVSYEAVDFNKME